MFAIIKVHLFVYLSLDTKEIFRSRIIIIIWFSSPYFSAAWVNESYIMLFIIEEHKKKFQTKKEKLLHKTNLFISTKFQMYLGYIESQRKNKWKAFSFWIGSTNEGRYLKSTVEYEDVLKHCVSFAEKISFYFNTAQNFTYQSKEFLNIVTVWQNSLIFSLMELNWLKLFFKHWKKESYYIDSQFE